MATQQTRDVHQMLVQCWASVADGGPTLHQHWVNVSCLLGIDFICFFCLSRWLPARDFQSGGRDQQSKLARVLPQPQRLHLALHHHPGTQGQTGKTRTLAVWLREQTSQHAQ